MDGQKVGSLLTRTERESEGEKLHSRKHIRLKRKHGIGISHNWKPENLGCFLWTLTIWVFLGKSLGQSLPQFSNLK